MDKTAFLTELEDLLQREEPCQEADKLADYEEWDSLAKMSLMAFYDHEFGISLKLADLKETKTVADLMALTHGKIA